jgi:FtsH-binding integral membrane protein
VAVTASTAVDLVIGLAVLAFILYRQMQVRPVRANMRLPLILAVIGVIEITSFFQHNKNAHHGVEVFAALAGSFVLAAVFGAIRALTVRLWFDAGQALRQGTWLTLVLWIFSLGVHLGYDNLVLGHGSLSGLGNATLTLYFAITYTIQRLILQARADRLGSGPRPGASDPGTRASSR